MPPPELFARHQKAVLWEASGVDNYGQHRVKDPVQIMVRWVSHDIQSTAREGDETTFDASVDVDRKIPNGSILCLGRIEDLPASETINGETYRLYQVDKYDSTPDIKGRLTKHTLSLMRFRNVLPPIN